MIKTLACIGIVATLLGPVAARAQFAPGQLANMGAAEPIAVGGMLAGGPICQYRDRFVDPSGRVIDTGNGGISHSEGQGYGMLIAVAGDDRASFDRMWAWTRAELGVRRDHLFGWKWDPSRARAVDANDASDGDLLIAWALAEAASYWSDSSYLVSATKIVADIESKLVRRYANPGAILLPATMGFSEAERADGPVVNLSYWIFPALARLAQLDGRPEWSDITKTGLSLIETARFGKSRLPVGWTSIGREMPTLARGHKIRFGYNAIRIPLYMYWSGLTSQSLFRDLIAAWDGGAGGVRVISGEAAEVDGPLPERGYGAIAALARCAANGRPFPPEFYKPTANENYYPTTLHILSIMAAVSRGGPCLDASAVNALVGPGWVARPVVAFSYGAPPPLSAAAATAPGLAPYAPPSVARPAGELLDRMRPSSVTTGSMGDTIGLVALFVVLLSGSIGVAAWLGDKDDTEVDAIPEVDPRPVIAAAATPVALAGRVVAAAPALAAPLEAMATVPMAPVTAAPLPPVARNSERVVEVFAPPLPSRRAEWSFDDPSFQRKVDAAIAISSRFGRAVALAALRVEGYASAERRYGRPDADEMIRMFVADLKPALAVGSCVSIQEGGIVFVCLAFVDREANLESAFHPMLNAALELVDANPGYVAIRPGHAVWPVDGDDATRLISVAHERCQASAPRAGLAMSA